MLKNNILIKRQIALVLIAVFFAQEFAFAVPVDPTPSALVANAELLARDPLRFEVPPEFATLKEIHKGSRDTFIIHIQDAHSNLSGQENLASALDGIMKKYGVYLVLVEGGSIEGTLTPLKKIAPAPVTRRVARSLLIDGRIAGEEYLNLVSDQPMKIMGVEDRPLYLESVRAYESLAAKREAILDYLKRMQGSVSKLKNRLYPEEILQYERRKDARGGPAMEQDLEGLLELAGRKMTDLSDLPNVLRLGSLQEKEKSIDFDAANLEQAALVAEIEKRGGLAELTAQLTASRGKDQKAFQSACLANLFEIAARRGVPVSKFPNLERYAAYLTEFSSLDLDEVLDELVRLEDRVYLAMLSTDDQKLLRAVDRYLRLLNTAYRIQMSTKDFLLFRANEKDFATVACLAFLNRKLAELGYFDDLLTYRDLLERGRESLEIFYDSVGRRDLAFVENARRILGDEKLKAAVLISGGYHTPHLKSLFKQNGFSYAVLTPVVTQETNQAKYEKLLLSTLRREVPKPARPVAKDARPLGLLEKDLLRARRGGDGVRYEEAAHRYLDVLMPLAEAASLTVNAPEVLEAKRAFEARAVTDAPAEARPTRPTRDGRILIPILPERKAGARLAAVPPTQVVGFFPGLGSRDAYQNLGSKLYDTGIPEVQRIYLEAAEAMGLLTDGRPDPSKLFLTKENLPQDPRQRGGFIGAAFVVHNLALSAYFIHEANRSGVPVEIKSYTGESFGILTAAIAAGSLSVGDGVKFAEKFTPCLLGCADESVAQDYHVIGIRSAELGDILTELRERFPEDVEVHKYYSEGPEEQINVYVSESVIKEFQAFMTRAYPAADVKELKAKTKFVAHSKKMARARNVLDDFINENNIFFDTPAVPIVSNNNRGILHSSLDVARAVLGIVDEPMYSRDTARMSDEMNADLILEFGLGGKTRALIEQNFVSTPYAEFTGEPVESDGGFQTLRRVHRLRETIESLRSGPQDAELGREHYDVLRDLFTHLPKDSPQQTYFFSVISKIVKEEMLQPDRNRPQAMYRYLEIIQNTYLAHNVIGFGAVAEDALILSAVFKKRILTQEKGDDRKVDVELLVLDRSGIETTLSFPNYKYPESVTYAFSNLSVPFADLARRTSRLLETQSLAWQIYEDLRQAMSLPNLEYFTDAKQIVDPAQYAVVAMAYQVALLKVMQMHRPSVFGQNFYYVTGSDTVGRMTALVASDALLLEDAVRLMVALRVTPGKLQGLLDTIRFRDSTIRILDPDTGNQVKKASQAEAFATRTLLTPTEPKPLSINFESWVVSFDPGKRAVPLTGLDTDRVVHVTGVDDVWKRNSNAELDLLDDLSLLRLTDQNGRVYRFAEGRGTTTSNVYAYINAGERVVGFGTGGSESLTVFVMKPGEKQVTVRKILSERLITAQWDREGTGVMLPPFDKAKKQALYLQGLPVEVQDLFPRVFNVTDRDLPISPDRPEAAKYGGKYRELIYDMSFVRGIEVSEFIRRHNPPPVVVARLYEEIFRVLRQRIHAQRRVAAPKENTLETSYLKKIEDRLALSRRTAPKVFSEQLLDSEFIEINGVRYLNIKPLLARLRTHPEYLAILEPTVHSLVMGDTNTENIKIGNPEPLFRAIENGTANFTAEEIGLKFLDPRAIGYKSDGAETRDDPMYDNKPWHNATGVGNYDLMHGEHFTLSVTPGAAGSPLQVRVDFTKDNPYGDSYEGIERYFKDVMTRAWGLDEPGSTYLKDDPYWTIRFAFMMGTHFTAMPPFHFSTDVDGRLADDYQHQRRPVAIYAEGIKWLNTALDMLEGRKADLYGIPVPQLPYATSAAPRAPPQTQGSTGEMYYGARLASQDKSKFLAAFADKNAASREEQAIFHTTWTGAVWQMVYNSGGTLRRGSWFANQLTNAKANGNSGDLDSQATPQILLKFDVPRLVELTDQNKMGWIPDNVNIIATRDMPLSALKDETKREVLQALEVLGQTDPANYPFDRAAAMGLLYPNLGPGAVFLPALERADPGVEASLQAARLALPVEDAAFTSLVSSVAADLAVAQDIDSANVRLVAQPEGPRTESIRTLNAAIDRWTVERAARVQTPITGEELSGLIDLLIARHSDAFRFLAEEMDDMEKYPGNATVGLGGKAGQPTIFLNSWVPGKPSRIHDHGRSKAAYRSFRGTFTERQYFRSRGGSYRLEEKTIVPGETLVAEPPYIHELANENTDGSRTVTINAYSPQLLLMNRYRVADGRMRFADQWLDDEVVHETIVSRGAKGLEVDLEKEALDDWRKDEETLPGYVRNAVAMTLLFALLQDLGVNRLELIKKGYSLEGLNRLYLEEKLDGGQIYQVLRRAALRALPDVRETQPLRRLDKFVDPSYVPPAAAPELDLADVAERPAAREPVVSGARLTNVNAESLAYMSPWMRVVRGTAVGQYPVDYDPAMAQNLRETFQVLTETGPENHAFNAFSGALTDFILTVNERGPAAISADDLAARTDALVEALKRVDSPYLYTTGSGLLFDTFAKLGLDRTLLVNDRRDLVADALNRLPSVPAEESDNGLYERLAASASVFIAIGQLGFGDKLVGEKDYVGESLELLRGIPSVYYRGRGGASLFTALSSLGYEARIFDGQTDYMKFVLDYFDEKLDRAPNFRNMRKRPSFNTYPLLTFLNAMALLGRREYLTYRRNWVEEAEVMMKALPPAQQVSQAQYYLVALYNLGELDRRVPDLEGYLKAALESWRAETAAKEKDVLDLQMHDAYAIEIPLFFGKPELISDDVVNRMADAFLVYKGGAPVRNSAYGSGYALTALGEIGKAGLLFDASRPNFDGEKPLHWAIRRFSEGWKDEAITVTYLHHALIGAALRMRGAGASPTKVFQRSEEEELSRISEPERLAEVSAAIDRSYQTGMGRLTAPLQPLGGGFQAYNRPFRATTAKGEFVVKREGASEPKAQAVAAAATEARKKGLTYVVDLIADDQGQAVSRIHGQYYTVQRFVNSKRDVTPQTARPEDWQEAVRAMAEMHVALRDVRVPGSAAITPPNDPRTYRYREEFVSFYKAIQARQKEGTEPTPAENLFLSVYPSALLNLDILSQRLSADTYDALPSQLIHADLRFKNMYFDGSKLEHLFDFGHAGFAPRVRDFVGLFIYNTGIPFDYQRLVDAAAYYNKISPNPLSDAEIQAIPEILRGTWLQFVRLFFWESDQFGVRRLNDVPGLLNNVTTKLAHMQGIPTAFEDAGSAQRFLDDVKRASGVETGAETASAAGTAEGARLSATTPALEDGVIEAELPFRLMYGALDSRLLADPSREADKESVFLAARVFAANPGLGDEILLKFDKGIASIRLAPNPATGGAAISFYDVEDTVLGRATLLGTIEISSELLAQARETNRQSLAPEITARAVDTQFLEAIAESARSVRQSKKLYAQAAPVLDQNKPVILRVTTGMSSSLTEAAKNEIEFMAPQRETLRAIAGKNVFVVFGYNRKVAAADGAFTYEFTPHDLPISDSVPAEIEEKAAVVSMGELTEDFVRMASQQGTGVAATPRIGEGEVLPFVAAATFSVINARSDSTQQIPELIQLWVNVRSLPTELTPEGRELLKKAPPAATVETYRPYTLRAIAKIAIDKFLSFARTALRAIASAA